MKALPVFTIFFLLIHSTLFVYAENGTSNGSLKMDQMCQSYCYQKAGATQTGYATDPTKVNYRLYVNCYNECYNKYVLAFHSQDSFLSDSERLLLLKTFTESTNNESPDFYSNLPSNNGDENIQGGLNDFLEEPCEPCPAVYKISAMAIEPEQCRRCGYAE